MPLYQYLISIFSRSLSALALSSATPWKRLIHDQFMGVVFLNVSVLQRHDDE
jgi:hypothetical protein